jgi:hypothetical protein
MVASAVNSGFLAKDGLAGAVTRRGTEEAG